MQYTGTAVQQVQQQYSRFAVLVQQYSQYSCQRIGQRPVYCSTAVQHSTAVQQYSSSTAVQQTAGAQAREHSVYRKTVLTRIEEKRQHLATYGWTYPTLDAKSDRELW